ncbi:hypothetical protein CWI38_1140p0020, partial [Hamiltosporidium tvaerminnensis]
LLITNIEDDIIFKKEFDIMNDKEYCSLFMLGYSSLDIIEEIRFSTVKTFFKSLDTQSKWDVSVYFLPSGFKLIYINEDSEEKRVYDFMSKVHILLRKKMLEIDVQKPEVFNCEILLSADISVSINQYGNGNNTASPFYRLAKFTDVKRQDNLCLSHFEISFIGLSERLLNYNKNKNLDTMEYDDNLPLSMR